MAKSDDQPKRKAKAKEKTAPSSEAHTSHAAGEPEPKMRSPIGPLMWLLVPFIGVIIYGLLTRD
jgi:hypothetical protein